MARPLDRLETEILELPQRERARLARRLIASLDDAEMEDPDEVEAAWEEEIRFRLEEYRKGSVKSIPSTEVFAEVRSRLRGG
nr:putative addiction module component [uncultured bacterium]